MTSPKKRKVSDLLEGDISDSDIQHKKRAIARPDGLLEKKSSTPSQFKDEK